MEASSKPATAGSPGNSMGARGETFSSVIVTPARFAIGGLEANNVTSMQEPATLRSPTVTRGFQPNPEAFDCVFNPGVKGQWDIPG